MNIFPNRFVQSIRRHFGKSAEQARPADNESSRKESDTPGDAADQSPGQSAAAERVSLMLQGIGKGWTQAAIGRLVTRAARNEAYKGLLDSTPSELIEFLKDMAGAAPVRTLPMDSAHPQREKLLKAFLEALAEALVSRRVIFLAQSKLPLTPPSKSDDTADSSLLENRRANALRVAEDWKSHMFNWIDNGNFEHSGDKYRADGEASNISKIGEILQQEQRLAAMSVWIGVIEVIHNALKDVRTF